MNPAAALARDLVRIDTAGENEGVAVELLARRLATKSIEGDRYKLAPGRECLVVRLPGTDGSASPLCFTGHLDTVGFGTLPWRHDPLSGHVDGDRLWGRGSGDMKVGVAAMVVAMEALAAQPRWRGIMLVLCAAEETGALGAAQIADRLGPLGAIVVGESTSNRVAVAHKGVTWVRLRARGVTAHASTPHVGANASNAMARALDRLALLDIAGEAHPHLGRPTLNVGIISGGAAPNIVADRCDATVDVRLVPGFAVEEAVSAIRHAVGDLVDVTVELALPPVETSPDDPWLATALKRAGGEPTGVAYFTDASVLAPSVSAIPVAIVGPGLAHQVDEWCSIAAIGRAAELYRLIGEDWATGEVEAG